MKAEVRKSDVFKWLVLFIVFTIASQVFFTKIPKEILKSLVLDAGITGPILVVLLIALSEILAPIPGSPAVLVSMAIFGWERTAIYSYLGLMIAVIVNFWISRLFGRKFILAAFGEKTLAQIDSFTLKQGKTALVIGRTLGYPFSDFISYAAGLTNIKFSTYFVISAVCLAIAHFAFLLLFKDLNFDATQDFVFWIVTAGVLAVCFGALLRRYYKK